MKVLLKRLLFAGLAMALLLSPMTQKTLPRELQVSVSVYATTKKQALKAYRKFLSQKKIPFYGRNEKTLKIKRAKTRFHLAYINKGKYPYLIVFAGNGAGVDYSTRFMNLYGAKGKKIKFIQSYGTLSYFKNKGVIGIPNARGMEGMTYYRPIGNRFSGPVSRPSGNEIFPNGYKTTKKNIKKYIR